MLVLTNKIVDFVPENQKGEEKPVTFKVKPPTREVVLEMQK